eukprot:TRINITY_DN8024_c0_g1_i1.p1 TRINITY_DN8024_c0_g1~~TRINITY_DN8024_c0_g1_i1.p1  ORF type:complete len:388 (+),score=105.90 TRINITY_DN8024_c0_g1_i1:263-1426(+)
MADQQPNPKVPGRTPRIRQAGTSLNANANRNINTNTSTALASSSSSLPGTESSIEPKVLDADAYTHGGVPKAKFVPKVPQRRAKKQAAVKKESQENTDSELSSELLKLVKQSKEQSSRGFGAEKKSTGNVRVAFGYGGSATAARAAAYSKGGMKSSHGGTREKKKTPLYDSLRSGVGDENLVRNVEDDDIEPFDYTTYYPVTLPMRKPFSGRSELSDEEELEGGPTAVFDEHSAVPPAEELDLWTEREDDRILFFQLPASLPLGQLPLTTENASQTATDANDNAVNKSGSTGTISGPQGPNTEANGALGKLPAGCMGKLLVYESGDVKLRLGNIILDATPGADCIFAQDVAAINSETKKCFFLGNINKRITLVPDINSLLDNTVQME